MKPLTVTPKEGKQVQGDLKASDQRTAPGQSQGLRKLRLLFR